MHYSSIHPSWKDWYMCYILGSQQISSLTNQQDQAGTGMTKGKNNNIKLTLELTAWTPNQSMTKTESRSDIFLPRTPGDVWETNQQRTTGNAWVWWHRLTKKNQTGQRGDRQTSQHGLKNKGLAIIMLITLVPGCFTSHTNQQPLS